MAEAKNTTTTAVSRRQRADRDIEASFAGFPRRVRSLRLHTQQTEAEFADRIGISVRSLRRIEAGKRKRVGVFLIWQLGEVTGASADWLTAGCFPCWAWTPNHQADDRPLLIGGAPMPPGHRVSSEARA